MEARPELTLLHHTGLHFSTVGSIQISSSEEEGPDPEVAELSASTVISNQSQLLL